MFCRLGSLDERRPVAVGHYLVLAFQCLEHFLACDKLPGLGLLRLLHYLHLAEQHVAHLLGRGYVELFAGQTVYAPLDVFHAGGKFF